MRDEELGNPQYRVTNYHVTPYHVTQDHVTPHHVTFFQSESEPASPGMSRGGRPPAKFAATSEALSYD